MNEVNQKQFTHLKIHTQYSICEGALRTSDLAKYCKANRIKAVGLCDTNNLCGALEFSESIAKLKTQPIVGTQINIQHKGHIGKIPLRNSLKLISHNLHSAIVAPIVISIAFNPPGTALESVLCVYSTGISFSLKPKLYAFTNISELLKPSCFKQSIGKIFCMDVFL